MLSFFSVLSQRVVFPLTLCYPCQLCVCACVWCGVSASPPPPLLAWGGSGLWEESPMSPPLPCIKRVIPVIQPHPFVSPTIANHNVTEMLLAVSQAIGICPEESEMGRWVRNLPRLTLYSTRNTAALQSTCQWDIKASAICC